MNFNIKLQVNKLMKLIAENKQLRTWSYILFATVIICTLLVNLAEIITAIRWW